MLIVCFPQGIYGRGHANADSGQGQRFRSRHWKLGCGYTVESNIPSRLGSDSMEILLCVRGME
jgi:hypothetical protein